MEFSADQPFKPSKKRPDLLGREDFCQLVAERICPSQRSPGITLSIEGKWGTGKTTVLDQIEQDLRKRAADQQPFIVRFNPWMIGAVEDLAQSFFSEVGEQLGRSTRNRRAAKKLARAFGGLAYIASIGAAFPKTAIAALPIRLILQFLSLIFRNWPEASITKQRERIISRIDELGIPIAIFIDDLDRLPPSELYAMIRLLKGVSDFPHVTYVMAYDPAYVSASLKESGVPFAESYLDKVVQVRIPLPRIRVSAIEKLAIQAFGPLLEQEPNGKFTGDNDRLGLLFSYAIRHLLQTPREIERIANRLRLSLPATRGEIAPSDMIAFEVIAIVTPQIFEHIRKYPYSWTGKQGMESGAAFSYAFTEEEVNDEQEEERKALFKTIDPQIRGPVQYVCDHLFPFASVRYGHQYSAPPSPPPRADGWIATPANLEIALAASLDPTMASLSTIRRFVAEPSERGDIIESLVDGTTLPDFVSNLKGCAATIRDISEPADLIKSLVKISQLDAVGKLFEEDERTLFGLGVSQTLALSASPVLSRLAPVERNALLNEILGDSKALAFSSEIVALLPREEESPQSRPHQIHPWLKEVDSNALIQRWLQTARTSFLEPPKANQSEQIDHLVYIRLVNTYPEEIAALFAALSQQPQSRDRLIRALAPNGCSSDCGPYIKLDDEALLRFGDPDQMREMARQELDRDDLDDKLRKTLESMATGKLIPLDPTDAADED